MREWFVEEQGARPTAGMPVVKVDLYNVTLLQSVIR
uniref:Uncharacterized protein n=1 Tax=Anguilla anguilla TaxID=7936 RepID=A0A0E9RRP7_ANGAN